MNILTIITIAILIITALPVIAIALFLVSLGFKGLWDLTHHDMGYDDFGDSNNGC